MLLLLPGFAPRATWNFGPTAQEVMYSTCTTTVREKKEKKEKKEPREGIEVSKVSKSEWSGVEWSGVEWSRVGLYIYIYIYTSVNTACGMEWSRVEWSGSPLLYRVLYICCSTLLYSTLLCSIYSPTTLL